MKILGLYNNECAIELFQWLESEGHDVILISDRLDADWCRKQDFDLAVSYTYRFILKQDVIDALKNNVVNIHNSMLPFNRGADPNLWSIVERTPRGVSLHYMDVELDKGYIIAQSIVNDTDEETLVSSYNNLDSAAKQLFKDALRYYDFWPQLKKKVEGKGTYHALKDAVEIKKVIDTYDLTITEFRERLEETVRGGLLEKLNNPVFRLCLPGDGGMSKVFLRKAEKNDMDLLFKWANDLVVRSNSFNSDPIPYENHVKWFNKMMEDSTVPQFILMDDDMPVGQIRLNIENDDAEIGYSIESEFRGKGYGHRILQLVADEVRESYPNISTLIAKVKPENAASNRLFESEGYECEYTCYTQKTKRLDE